MALIDNIITVVNASIDANLAWLDNTYGKVQRLKKRDSSGNVVTYPAVYKADGLTNDFIAVLPDDRLGNYCYWEVFDDQNYKVQKPHVAVSFRFKLVFWFKWSDIYADYKERSIEEVKSQILTVLAATQYTGGSESEWTIHEQHDRIFSGYTAYLSEGQYGFNEEDHLHLMRPYGGLAFEGEIYAHAGCVSDAQAPTIPVNLFSLIPLNYSASEQVYWMMKWFGETVYWRTWSLDTGTNNYENLTGLTTDIVGKIIKTEYRAVNGVSGTEENGPIQIDVDGTQYRVFTLSAHTQIYVTVFYTK